VLGRKLGVGLMPYYKRHVSSRRPPLIETSEDLRRLIAEHNALDVELYGVARERFEGEAPPPGQLEDQVEELRRRSLEVTEAADAVRRAKKEANKARKQAEKAEMRSTGTRRARGRERGPKAERRAVRAAATTGGGGAEERPRSTGVKKTKIKARLGKPDTAE
jgi:hypothetical protein